MHEWALAESVVVTVVNEAERHNLKRIAKITVKMGELQQVDLDIFKFALEQALNSYDLTLDSENIIIETDRSILRCKVCGEQWSFRETLDGLKGDEAEAIHFIPEVAHAYIRCPKCGSPDFEIMTGRGVWIESIEGEE